MSSNICLIHEESKCFCNTSNINMKKTQIWKEDFLCYKMEGIGWFAWLERLKGYEAMATYSLIFLYFLIITCFITKCSPDIIILCKDFALISINLFLFFKIRWSIPSKMACCFKWSLNTYNANTYSRKIKLNPSHIQFKIINMVSKKFKKIQLFGKASNHS